MTVCPRKHRREESLCAVECEVERAADKAGKRANRESAQRQPEQTHAIFFVAIARQPAFGDHADGGACVRPAPEPLRESMTKETGGE